MWLWTLLAVFISIVFIIKVYQKLTCGICKSSVHMVGKVVIVTGGNSGIGLETAKNLAERGARVILACRSVTRGEEAKKLIIELTGNTDIDCRQLDLASFRSIREFVNSILKTEKRLDVLINNAGGGGLGNFNSEDGLHIGMQVNYFGPCLLTCLLIPLLKSSAPSRIINVSSMVHKYAVLEYDNLNMEKYWSDTLVYANSKLFLNMMTFELSCQLKGSGVTVNTLHPGMSATNIFRNIKSGLIRGTVERIIGFMFQSPWEAAQTSIYLAVSPEVKEISGGYFQDCREKKPSKLSQCPENTAKLWAVTEKLIKYSLADSL